MRPDIPPSPHPYSLQIPQQDIDEGILNILFLSTQSFCERFDLTGATSNVHRNR